MKVMDLEQILLRIFISEADQINGKPAYEAIVNMLRAEKIAGATVIRGIEGFGAKSHIHKTSVIALSQNLPIIIEVIDSKKNIDWVLPKIDEMMNDGLVTMENVRVLKYEQQQKNGEQNV